MVTSSFFEPMPNANSFANELCVMHLHLFITQRPYFFNSYFHLGITTLNVLKAQSKCALAKNLHDFFLRNVFSYLQLVGINAISIQACPHKMNKISF
jgi:hypothetical protein